MRLKQILLLALIVSWPRLTDRPTDRQCQLLSCPGQLKMSSGKKTATNLDFCDASHLPFTCRASVVPCELLIFGICSFADPNLLPKH